MQTSGVILSVSVMIFSLILLALPIRNAFGRILRILLFIGILIASVSLLLFAGTPFRQALPAGPILADHFEAALFVPFRSAQTTTTILDITSIISNIVSIITGIIGIIKDIVGLVRGPQRPPPPVSTSLSVPAWLSSQVGIDFRR